MALPVASVAQQAPEQARKTALIRGAGPRIDIDQAPQRKVGRFERSLDETINQELFTLTIVYAILAILPLTVLGIVAFNARKSKTKINAKYRRRRVKTRAAPSAEKSEALIYTSDLYDVAPRGRDGQVVSFQRSRQWRYKKETVHHLPFPVAEIQARSVKLQQSNQIPKRQRTRHQWKYKESAASSL